jgi:hypothetical protein
VSISLSKRIWVGSHNTTRTPKKPIAAKAMILHHFQHFCAIEVIEMILNLVSWSSRALGLYLPILFFNMRCFPAAFRP